MTLKQDGVHFSLCPKQDNQIEGGVLKAMYFRNFFCPKQGSSFLLREKKENNMTECGVKWRHILNVLSPDLQILFPCVAFVEFMDWKPFESLNLWMCHSLTYNLSPVFVDAYKYSFSASCILMRNSLPFTTDIAPSLPVFKSTAKTYLSPPTIATISLCYSQVTDKD